MRRDEGKEVWHRLLEWDRGQTPAERLSSLILRGEGFGAIDPSHPLGGRDGLKDLTLSYAGEKWIAGVYFPRGQQSFNEIKQKFEHDIKGVKVSASSGFAFITNQELRLAERKELIDLYPEIDVDIFHLERIASILNSPQNYGIRLEFLDIDMTKEEQLALFAINEKRIASFEEKINQLTIGLDEFKEIVLFTMKDEYFEGPRSLDEIGEMANEICEMIWFDRHLVLREKVEKGIETVDSEIWKGALESAERVIKKYGEENLSPYSKFDWGILNGKLSAIRWVMGEEWDMLDT